MMDDISLGRYIKKPKGSKMRHTTINQLKQDQDIRKILETVIINKTEFELIQENQSNKVTYPLLTCKRPVSSMIKERNKINGVISKPKLKKQPISIIYTCDSGDNYTYIPSKKNKGELIISNNQFGLESNDMIKQQPSIPFKNLLIESVESNQSFVNLTTSIDSKADNYNISTVIQPIVLKVEEKHDIEVKVEEVIEDDYQNSYHDHDQPMKYDINMVKTSINSKPEVRIQKKSQPKPIIMKKTNIINKIKTDNNTTITIGKDKASTSSSFRNNNNNNNASYRPSKKNPIQIMKEKVFLIANSSHEAQPLKIKPSFIASRNEAMKKKLKYVSLLNTGHPERNCLLARPSSKVNIEGFNHIKYAKDCPCKDHTKVYTSKYYNDDKIKQHESLHDSILLRSQRILNNNFIV